MHSSAHRGVEEGGVLSVTSTQDWIKEVKSPQPNTQRTQVFHSCPEAHRAPATPGNDTALELQFITQQYLEALDKLSLLTAASAQRRLQEQESPGFALRQITSTNPFPQGMCLSLDTKRTCSSEEERALPWLFLWCLCWDGLQLFYVVPTQW